ITQCSPYTTSQFASSRAHHSFPTRRSSDLPLPVSVPCAMESCWSRSSCGSLRADVFATTFATTVPLRPSDISRINRRSYLRILRSEEHTSELQSRENLVCRLLLEKKNYPN